MQMQGRHSEMLQIAMQLGEVLGKRGVPYHWGEGGLLNENIYYSLLFVVMVMFKYIYIHTYICHVHTYLVYTYYVYTYYVYIQFM